MTIHRAPGLLKEQWVENAAAIHAARSVRYKQAYANLAVGLILSIYEADSRDVLVEHFEEMGFPFDEIQEIQLSQSFDEMEQMLLHMGRATSGSGSNA
jgi:hypothetical protein